MISALHVGARTTMRCIDPSSTTIGDRRLTLELFPLHVPEVCARLGALVSLIDRLRRWNDTILARLPIDWAGNPVLGDGLERLQAPQDRVNVSSEWARIVHGETDDPLWVNEEDAADGKADL